MLGCRFGNIEAGGLRPLLPEGTAWATPALGVEGKTIVNIEWSAAADGKAIVHLHETDTGKELAQVRLEDGVNCARSTAGAWRRPREPTSGKRRRENADTPWPTFSRSSAVFKL